MWQIWTCDAPKFRGLRGHRGQDDSLAKAIGVIASIEVVREGLVGGIIFGQAGVEQIDGNEVSGYAGDEILPNPDVDDAA